MNLGVSKYLTAIRAVYYIDHTSNVLILDLLKLMGKIMRKFILAPIVLGALVSAVITGCSGDDPEKPGKKEPCNYIISGGNAVDVMFGTLYDNPDAKVTQESKEIKFNLEGTVNTSKLGIYKVTYKGDNCSNSQVRTVKVVPSSCTYKVTGDNPFKLNLGKDYVEPGVEVKDINNKVIQPIVTGNVDKSKVGEYPLVYKGEGCKNSQTRIVKVAGGSCSYTLLGSHPLILKLGGTYNDPGVKVKDVNAQEVTSTASGAVDTSIAGDYTVTYQGAGCSNTTTRKVTIKPAKSVCTYDLKGSNPFELIKGVSYQEPGLSIKGVNGQAVTGTISGSVDTSKIGDNTITYQGESCSNAVTRTVKVVSADCSYTLQGNDPLMLSKNDTFSDPGVVVKNSNDLVVTSTMSGDVDTATVADYTLTYQGKDCANSQTRTVIVELQTCAYTLLGNSPLEIIVNTAYTDSGVEIKDKSGTVITAMGTGTVDTTKVGEYAVNYKVEACGNSIDRIVKVRALTDDELKDTILPRL